MDPDSLQSGMVGRQEVMGTNGNEIGYNWMYAETFSPWEQSNGLPGAVSILEGSQGSTGQSPQLLVWSFIAGPTLSRRLD